jgi:serine/threonine protein kinase/Tol biopolymer transport system component
MPLAPGTILGQYEIRAPLGAGGMGEVYRARDTRLDRDVALKVLPASLTSDPDRLRRFEQEARAAAALNHPNILAVYQMATQGGVSYLVSELLEGETLRERLKRGPVPLRKAIDYAVQIAHGLAAPHEKGIVHRDLKPENLFLTNQGRVKILDFGLAKISGAKDTSGSEPTLAQGTEAGTVMGTVGYMSPEQVRGKNVDYRSDIFTFGTILYELVTGKQTFHKPTSAETMTAILNEEPAPISQLAPTTPPGLLRVINRCLEKNPDQRFQSASDLAFALEALSDSGIGLGTSPHAVSGERPSRRWMMAVGALVVVVLGAAVLTYLWMQPPAVPRLSNYVQLTKDGLPKRIVGTDGSRLYLYRATSKYLGMEEMSVTGGEPRKSTILPSPNMSPLALSPDGSELLATDVHGVPPIGPLWSFPVLGGSPHRIGDIEAVDARSSPDGKMITYSTGNDLFVAKIDGTESRKVASTKRFIINPVFSPDGTSLRFDDTNFIASWLWEASLDHMDAHQLLPGWTKPPDSECCGAWSTDGKYFLYQSKGQIWAIPRKHGLVHSAKPVQLTSSPLSLQSFLPSKDGKKLFVVGQTFRGELTRYDLKSRRLESFLGGISAEFAAFSKDKLWVAYVAYPENKLWRSKVDGSERLQLTTDANPIFLPRWSPDGKKIVFFELFPDGHSTIYEVSPEGGSPRPLAIDDPHQVDPTWSSDGSKIMFGGSNGDPASTIRTFDLTIHKIQTLPGSTGLYSPRWSPDGRYVAAFSADSTRLSLFDFKTQKWSEITKGTFGWECWSNTGEYLFALDSSDTGAVLRIRLSDRTIERVLNLKDISLTGYWGNSLTLAPDDSPLLLRNVGTQDVYALDWETP